MNRPEQSPPRRRLASLRPSFGALAVARLSPPVALCSTRGVDEAGTGRTIPTLASRPEPLHADERANGTGESAIVGAGSAVYGLGGARSSGRSGRRSRARIGNLHQDTLEAALWGSDLALDYPEHPPLLVMGHRSGSSHRPRPDFHALLISQIGMIVAVAYVWRTVRLYADAARRRWR